MAEDAAAKPARVLAVQLSNASTAATMGEELLGAREDFLSVGEEFMGASEEVLGVGEEFLDASEEFMAKEEAAPKKEAGPNKDIKEEAVDAEKAFLTRCWTQRWPRRRSSSRRSSPKKEAELNKEMAEEEAASKKEAEPNKEMKEEAVPPKKEAAPNKEAAAKKEAATKEEAAPKGEAAPSEGAMEAAAEKEAATKKGVAPKREAAPSEGAVEAAAEKEAAAPDWLAILFERHEQQSELHQWNPAKQDKELDRMTLEVLEEDALRRGRPPLKAQPAFYKAVMELLENGTLKKMKKLAFPKALPKQEAAPKEAAQSWADLSSDDGGEVAVARQRELGSD